MKAITLTAAAFAADIDIEHALETLRPGHRCLTFGGCLRSLDTLILFPLPRVAGVTNAPPTRRFRHLRVTYANRCDERTRRTRGAG